MDDFEDFDDPDNDDEALEGAVDPRHLFTPGYPFKELCGVCGFELREIGKDPNHNGIAEDIPPTRKCWCGWPATWSVKGDADVPVDCCDSDLAKTCYGLLPARLIVDKVPT